MIAVISEARKDFNSKVAKRMWANVPEGERVDQKGVSKSKILDDQNKIEALNGVINEMGTLIDVGMVGTLILEEI